MVIKIYKRKFSFYKNLYNQTAHSVHRTSRFLIAESLEPGTKHFLQFFEVDKGHPNGSEIHALTEQGVIYIFNKETGKLITCLIARPAQLARYYEAVGAVCPKKAYRLAQIHESQRLNEC